MRESSQFCLNRVASETLVALISDGPLELIRLFVNVENVFAEIGLSLEEKVRM